jgi:FlaA1/EpsC-like NDP-sugar epimerase
MFHKFIEKLQKSNFYTSKWIVLLIDIAFVVQTFFVAYLIFYNFKLSLYNSFLFHQVPLIILISVISFIIIGSHKGIIRHTGINDAYKVFLAVTLSTFILILIVYLNRNLGSYRVKTFIPVSISILIIQYFLNIIVLIASRFIFRQVYERLTSNSKKSKNVVIYGAGESGMITYASFIKTKNYSVHSFIDDNKNLHHKNYDGKKIFSNTKLTEKFIRKNKIDELIISIQNIDPLHLLSITDSLANLPITIKIVPPVENWIDGDLNIKQIKEIKIEDLLNRSQIKVTNTKLENEFKNKTILVTGAAGSIGSEITKQLTNYSAKKIILLDQAESDLYDLQQELLSKNYKNLITIISDIRNLNRLDAVFKKYNIDIVFHAAAYKHVPLMENNPYEAVRVNVLGTKNLMDLAGKYQVSKFVMISTDKAVNPTNVMGATKRIAEMYARCLKDKSKTKYIITRFGNVLGSNGSVIPLFKKQIANGGPLTVTHKDITRFFMTIPEACQLVLQAGALGKGGEIFVFDMGESVKIFNVAKKMIQLSGFKYPNDIDIKIVGLRPGEKLYEELLSDKETTLPTYHNKIMIAKVKDFDFKKIDAKIGELSTIDQLNKTEIVAKIKSIVPEYISNNSEFEKLD